MVSRKGLSMAQLTGGVAARRRLEYVADADLVVWASAAEGEGCTSFNACAATTQRKAQHSACRLMAEH